MMQRLLQLTCFAVAIAVFASFIGYAVHRAAVERQEISILRERRNRLVLVRNLLNDYRAHNHSYPENAAGPDGTEVSWRVTLLRQSWSPALEAEPVWSPDSGSIPIDPNSELPHCYGDGRLSVFRVSDLETATRWVEPSTERRPPQQENPVILVEVETDCGCKWSDAADIVYSDNGVFIRRAGAQDIDVGSLSNAFAVRANGEVEHSSGVLNSRQLVSWFRGAWQPE